MPEHNAYTVDVLYSKQKRRKCDKDVGSRSFLRLSLFVQ